MHSIPTTTDKPVYLPHRQIPVQLQSEVRKCLDNWLKQGIMHPSKSLYKFTRMLFGLTNTGASFCHLMEMCIGDQQYITLLFYLDDICIFSETADQMLDCIELVFSRLKEFNLKIKPKKSYFFQTSVTFLGHILSANGISPNPEKVAKVKDWPVPKTPKEVHSFVVLSSYIVDLFQILQSGQDHCTPSLFLPVSSRKFGKVK